MSGQTSLRFREGGGKKKSQIKILSKLFFSPLFHVKSEKMETEELEVLDCSTATAYHGS